MEIVKNRICDLARNGRFGAGELLAVENDSVDGKGAQFMSEILYFRLKFREEHFTKVRSIFVKIQLKDEQRAKDFSTDIQFNNEVAMYGKILRQLGAYDINAAPEMLYGFSTNGLDIEQDIIVMEDLRFSGYKIAENLFLDYDHVVLAMRKLGEYHGLSYKMKKESPKKFEDLCNLLQSRNFKLPDGFFEGSLYRGFKSIIDNPVAKDAHEKLYGIMIKRTGKSLTTPDEPFAVISHGDFNKNNCMYEYDDEGNVVSIKFIDFANSLYSDPTGDISFFLYLNTSQELRQSHWDDFLQVYWEGVSYIGHPGFSYEEFLGNFAKRVIWGYVPCCFFLPILMFPEVLQEKIKETPPEEKYALGLTAGGADATVAVSNIIRHLLDRGYLEEFAYKF